MDIFNFACYTTTKLVGQIQENSCHALCSYPLNYLDEYAILLMKSHRLLYL